MTWFKRTTLIEESGMISQELKDHYMDYGQKAQWIATEVHLNILENMRSCYPKEQSEAMRWAIDYIRSSKLPGS